MNFSKTHGKRDHLFFSILTLLISAIGFAGFSFTYFGPMIGGSYPPSPVILHLHGWSFFLWYLLFPFQAILIARGKYVQHILLGRLSVILVVLMSLTGVFVLTAQVDEAMRNGSPQIWLLYGPLVLSNLVLFVLFYAVGIYMAIKNRLQSHKRLIIVSSAIGLGAGFFRLIFFLSGFHPMSLPAGVLSCSLFIIIGMVYDWITHKLVHPAYFIGLAVMLVVEVSLLPQLNGEMITWMNEGLASLGKLLSDFFSTE